MHRPDDDVTPPERSAADPTAREPTRTTPGDAPDVSRAASAHEGPAQGTPVRDHVGETPAAAASAGVHAHPDRGRHPAGAGRGDRDQSLEHDHGHDHLPDTPNSEHDDLGGYGHDHSAEQGHEHAGTHGHGHEHGRDDRALFHRVGHVLPFFHDHSHDIGETASDRALEGSSEGIRVVGLSLAVLGFTAAVQLAIAVASGSVGLLADTIHNAADALTAIPLWIAFTLGRRPPGRRYTYGYGRAEDAAGLAVVGIIFISAAVALIGSIQKLLHPQPMTHLPFVALGAIVGFVGNELVALLRIKMGGRIGSAALVADGKHAQADGLTSLAVLLSVVGAIAGFPIVDPIIGVVISAVIIAIGRDAGRMMWWRLMDAVDPGIVDGIERVAATTPGVLDISEVRARWIGHRIVADLRIAVDQSWTVAQGHELAEEIHHRLLHEVPRLASAHVHVDPDGAAIVDPHALTAHHRREGSAPHDRA